MSDKHEYSKILRVALGLCVQGDVVKAYEYLQSQSDIEEQEAQFAEHLHERFFTANPIYEMESEDFWVRNVVSAYYRYFTAVLTKRVPPTVGEELLLSELSKFVTAHSLESAEEKLEHEFSARGYYFLGGKTQPYWGPYIWRSQESKSFDVTIPSGIQQLTVHFMSDFLMVSWLNFATRGLSSTGGWVMDDGIYCVSERYGSIDNNPEFEVSLLKHEAQHIADFRMFPDLTSNDLEYRAKLVELIYSPTRDKLSEFVADAADIADNAHAHAAFTIVSKLSKQLFSTADLTKLNLEDVRVEQIQEAAGRLLDEHTSDLFSGGNCR